MSLTREIVTYRFDNEHFVCMVFWKLEKLGVSPEFFARYIGKSDKYFVALQSSKHPPHLSTLVLVCNELNLYPGEFFTRVTVDGKFISSDNMD